MDLVFKLMFSNQTDKKKKKKATDLLSENLLFFYFICVLYRGFNIELRVAFHICKNAYTLILQYFLLPNKLLSVFKDFILDAALFEWTKILCIKKNK